ncbi:MAG: hypothetical protein WBM09_11975 [Gallionella sp.]
MPQVAHAKVNALMQMRARYLRVDNTGESKQDLLRTFSCITTPLGRIANRSDSGLLTSCLHDGSRKIPAMDPAGSIGKPQEVSARPMQIFSDWQAAPYSSANFREN